MHIMLTKCHQLAALFELRNMIIVTRAHFIHSYLITDTLPIGYMAIMYYYAYVFILIFLHISKYFGEYFFFFSDCDFTYQSRIFRRSRAPVQFILAATRCYTIRVHYLLLIVDCILLSRQRRSFSHSNLIPHLCRNRIVFRNTIN